jgi:hypothetical protein
MSWMQTLFGSSLSGTAAAAQLQAAKAAEVQAARLSSAGTMPVVVGPSSPYHETDHLQAIVWADLTGQEFQPVTRAAAMSIPAVARHRHLVCGVVARSPLVRLIVDARQPTPRWATRTDGELSPYHRMLWTTDDLIFHGWSVWLAERDTHGLARTTRIAPDRWDTDPAGRLQVDGELVDNDKLILIPGPHEGILNFGHVTLRRTLDNLEAAAIAARNPAAYLELHYTGDEPLTDPQIDTHIARWAAARKGQNGGVAWTNKWLEVKEHGTHEAHLLIEGRNADAVDAARMISNPAAMADATSSGASLTYETTEGRNDQFLEYGAGLYMDAVAARLSMDDVVGPTERMAFDTTASTAKDAPATGPTLED